MHTYSTFARIGAFAAFASLAPANVIAAENDVDDRFYVAPMAVYQVADGDRGTNDGIGASVSLGKRFADNFAVELSAFFIGADADNAAPGGSGSLDLSGAEISALIFPRNSLPNLFGTVGAGFLSGSDHPGSPSGYDSPIFHAGVGYLIPLPILTEGTSLRTEAKFFLDAHSERSLGNGGRKEFYDTLFGIGLHIPLGSPPAPPAPPPKPPVKLVPVIQDSDGDGVFDNLDQCPGTPPNTKVDHVGCALPPPPPPADPDCKAPEAGKPINLEGCATGDVIVLHGVNFEYDRSRLTPNAKGTLSYVARALKQVSDMPVQLSGHTDSRGSDSYNQSLSERRAQSVKNFLIRKGIPSDMLSSRGYGESQPIASNDTEEGRELNRRVEMMFME